MHRVRSLLPLILVAVALPGCGDNYTFIEVEGDVTLNGKPLPEVAVAFLPDGPRGTKGPISRGITDDKGHYRLSYAPEKFGAVVGFHRVFVDDAKAKAEHSGRSRVPSRYEGLINNPLDVVQVKEGQQTHNLKLTSP